VPPREFLREFSIAEQDASKMGGVGGGKDLLLLLLLLVVAKIVDLYSMCSISWVFKLNSVTSDASFYAALKLHSVS